MDKLPIAAITLGVSAIVGLPIWLLYPKEVTGQVTHIEWVYQSDLRQKTLMHDSGWGSPSGAFNVTCRRKYYGEEDCNYHPCNPHMNAAEVLEYDTCHSHCDVYRDWCEYDYYDWPIIKTLQTMGSRHNEYWPDLQPTGPDQRLDRKERYKVEFAGETRWTYQPNNLVDFQRFEVDAYWRLKVNRLKMATPLKLLRAEWGS